MFSQSGGGPGRHKDAAALITKLAEQLASHTGESIKHLFQKASFQFSIYSLFDPPPPHKNK